MIKDLASVYKLSKDAIAPLEGFGELSARNLLTAIEDSRKPQLPRFLYGLGIPNVGEKTAADMARHFGTFAAIRNATTDQLLEVEGVGPIVAESVVDFFSNPSVNAELERLLDEVIPEAMEAAQPAKTELAGKTFVFTGTLGSLSRSEAQRRIEALGARASSSVSSGTDYVVHGPGAGSKLAKAKELSIQLLSEEEFLELIGEA